MNGQSGPTENPITSGAVHSTRDKGLTALLGLPLGAMMSIGVVLPLLLLVGISLGGKLDGWSTPYDLNFLNYRDQLTSPYVWKVTIFTLTVSCIISGLNVFLAYPLAYFLARSKSKWRGVILLISFTPLAVGMNMLTIGWLIILGKSGVVNSLLIGIGIIDQPLSLIYGVSAVIIGLAHVSFTFMLLPIESVLRGINPTLEKAARSLGASWWRAFLTITLPLSFEGIAAGMLIVFMQSCGAFVIPLFLGNLGTVMFPVAIWEQITIANDWQAASTLAVFLTFIALMMLWLQLRFFNPMRSVGAL